MSVPGFIDMQRSYSEGVGQGYNSKPPVYSNNIRYQLARLKVDDLFLKWLSMASSQKLINSLIVDIKSGKQAQLISQPNAYFTNKFGMSGGSMSQSTVVNSPNRKQPIRVTPTTPPRNESLFELKQVRSSSEDFSQSLTQSQVMQRRQQEIYVEPSRINPILVPSQQYEAIPQFYFPEGKMMDASILNEQQRIINEEFKLVKNDEMDVLYQLSQFNQVTQFLKITTLVCGLPKSLNPIVFKRLDPQGSGKVSKQNFLKYWNLNLVNKDPKCRCFYILKKPLTEYIEFDDLRPYMKILLETHPGLEFLQATPEFQERYTDTVVHRMLYNVNRRDNGKISWREFKQSDLFSLMEIVDKEEDINKVRQYFSYEHFYVIYCKFWELDIDHDFHISKDDFSRYQSHALSKKVVDRIFDQVPRRFKSLQQGKMSYEDFIWFILCEEDKTTPQSVDYWFKILDLDDNGIITGQEMEYFYEELRQRMDYLNQETVLFQDIVCQMVDLLHPDNDILFKPNHFKNKLHVCGVFFNFLTNLNKLVAYEQRDPFQVKHELTEHPGFSDWDRFAQQEYLRLAMEEENQDNGEVFEVDNAWENEGDDNKGDDNKSGKN